MIKNYSYFLFVCPYKMDAADRVGQMLSEHWVWCNVYTKQVKNVSKQVLNCWLDFKQMASVRKDKQTEEYNLKI